MIRLKKLNVYKTFKGGGEAWRVCRQNAAS